MKKLITIAAVLFLGITMATAGNGNSIHHLITEQIKVPAELKSQKMNEKVCVEFRINSNGNISVINVNTANSELKSSVLEQMKKIDFSKVKESKETTYFVDINFRIL